MKQVLLLAPDADAEHLRALLRGRGADATALVGQGGRALLVDDDAPTGDLPGVTAVLRAPSPHPRVDGAPRSFALGDALGGPVLGGTEPVLMAGPCVVEDEETLERCAAAVAAAGGRVLRGGAFKPRTSPYDFDGLGEPALAMLRAAADRHGLAVVTEALGVRDVEAVAAHADLVQIGSRNMQNQPLLRAAGACGKPALLKRGAAATIEEWLLAAEYLLDAGAPGVALCERGLRTLPQPLRYTLDLGAVAWLLAHVPLPIVVDPSHAAGRRALVAPLARAALAAGAHGLLVEIHPAPERARCDGAQALLPDDLPSVLAGRSLYSSPHVADRDRTR